MKYRIKNIVLILLSVFSVFLVQSCEDAPPTDYIPQHYVEAFILVGEPIAKIRIYLTQPTTSNYSDSAAIVRDADIRIYEGEKELKLQFRDKPYLDYFYSDTSYKIKPNTNYKLKITLTDGKIITGETTTLSAISWVKPPSDKYQFPKDTINPEVDTVGIEWTKAPGIFFYIISLRCLDTLNYGKYLAPETEELNRRAFNPFYRENDKIYRELSTINFVANYKTPVVWMAFKWFGRHEVSAYAPDANYLKWFKNQLFSQYNDPLMSSVTNAIGVFGSASVVRKESFLIKNQK